ncbi:MAG: T9SS type A sorting domain-containing protein [Calditrichaceae bacterium]|nr:T9SS type A sorting domain-containing protein [Calditrichaceae bacterium]
MPNRMLKLICIFIMLSGSVWAQQPRAGHLANLIADIRDAMPGRDSYAYIAPTSAQRDSFELIINKILNENYAGADSIASNLNYVLYEYTDTGSGNRTYYVLMEENADKEDSIKLGWGTYIFDPAGSDKAVIEIPHPMFDTNTWLVGISAYQALDSKFFLMAGTHRYANGSNPAPADVAHNTSNIFHLVHCKIASHSDHTVQIHGYSRSTREEYAAYPDAIISNGTSSPSAILDSLDEAIEDEGYTCGIFNGVDYAYLGATTNKQGQFSNSNGYSFVHMELEYFIRSSQDEWTNIIDALNNVFLLGTALKSIAGKQILIDFYLGDNYPNPFNPQTVIPFYLNDNQHIQMHIYNDLGQHLTTLVTGQLQPGYHEIIWNGRDSRGNAVASGHYYYVMITNDQTHTKSMILLR